MKLFESFRASSCIFCDTDYLHTYNPKLSSPQHSLLQHRDKKTTILQKSALDCVGQFETGTGLKTPP